MNTRRHLPIWIGLLLVGLILSACGSSEQVDIPTLDASPDAQSLPAEPVTSSPTAQTSQAPTEPAPTYQTYEIGTDIWGLTIADLNGDTHPDIAVTDRGSDALRLLFNQGDGTFQEASEIATSTDAYGVVAADLNGDSHTDLAVAYQPEGQLGKLSVLLNNGDGTFQTAVDYVTSYDSWFVSATDLDGDTDLDLLIEVATDKMPQGESGAGIWLNNGDGSFQVGERLYFDVGMLGNIIASDLDGDTYPDLAVRHYPDPIVSVLLGNGDGSFREPFDYETVDRLHNIISADLNEDAYPDLVAVNAFGLINVLINEGDGTFQDATEYDVGGDIYNISAVDMDGDAALDLLVGPTASGMASLLLNNGEGAFELTRDYYFKGAWASFFTLGDVDGDSFPEMVGYGDDSVYVFPLEESD